LSQQNKKIVRKFRPQDETRFVRKDVEKARTTQRRQARQMKALTNSTI
jgi:hypothetical protein